MMAHRTISFRDKNNKRWNVTEFIESFADDKYDLQNNVIHGGFTIIINVNGCNGSMTDIVPRTASQKLLIEYWKQHKEFYAGTENQEEYLSGAFKVDYESVKSEVAKSSDDEECNSIVLGIIFRDFLRTSSDIIRFRTEMPQIFFPSKKCDFVEIANYIAKNEMSDFKMQEIFLSLRGLFVDAGYSYGSGWLYRRFTKQDIKKVDEIFNNIAEEEHRLTLSLCPRFDMGAEGFTVTSEIIRNVCDIRDCDEDEAKRFLALGMYLKCTFGDLDNTFQCEDEENLLYSANGYSYYVGNKEELDNIARKLLLESGRETWVEACRAETCSTSFEEWVDCVIDTDGFSDVLNSYDGTAGLEIIMGENYEICRQC